jgi:hypothetical protein
MLEDLQIRNYSPSTVKSYVRSVADFAKHFNRSPDLRTGLGARSSLPRRPGRLGMATEEATGWKLAGFLLAFAIQFG